MSFLVPIYINGGYTHGPKRCSLCGVKARFVRESVDGGAKIVWAIVGDDNSIRDLYNHRVSDSIIICSQ